MRRAMLVAAAALLAATPALAKPPVAPEPDSMTVSGRHGLPRATDAAPRLTLGTVTIAPAVATRASYTASAAEPALRAAVERTLDNHGFIAATAAPALAAQWSALDVASDETGATVTAHLRLTADNGPACLPYEATGSFRALARKKSGNGRRIAGVLGTVATMGLDGGTVLARQMEWAAAENRAMNAARDVGEAEGIAPGFDETSLVQYGAANAMRLALANLVTHLNSTACAAQP